MINYKINEKGFSVVHASCISGNAGTFLFAGRSGVGKTLIALFFIEQGFNFIGDNYIILKNGCAYSYFSP